MGGNGVFSIVVGVDGSAPSRRALEWAVEEALLRGGEVHAVTAWAFPPVTVGMEGLIHDPDLFPQAARRLQDETLKRVDSKGVPISGEVDQGSAAAVLLRAAEDADLLVVGSRGLGGVYRVAARISIQSARSSFALPGARCPVRSWCRGMSRSGRYRRQIPGSRVCDS